MYSYTLQAFPKRIYVCVHKLDSLCPPLYPMYKYIFDILRFEGSISVPSKGVER